MLRFKTFETTDEFELWQQQHSVDLYQLSPIVLTAGGSCSELVVDMKTTVGCFVVYSDKLEEVAPL